ncbi:hypothetical protein C3B61_06975 [Cryobacterium zongtaii]|uniref:Uncharacterized protein n=1 Tax=Cryobacterium zongtaii TaxID=1259217 RepID=A0A2S3ZJ92_9MICO|nr:hypothetical protein [Cryobacterium zongtaii]POH67630.1 hypothetical protein C3B61_06975 [Cryobacterium zongtaii]
MAEAEDRPGVNAETVAVQAGELNKSIVSAEGPIPAGRPVSKIGATVEKALNASLWRLRLGEIGLQDLTPALMGFCTLSYDDGYEAGFTAGVASGEIELAQIVADRDRYYRAAFNPHPPVKIGPSYADRQASRAAFYRGDK